MSTISKLSSTFDVDTLINPRRELLRLQVLDDANQRLARERADFEAYNEWVAPFMVTSLGAAITGVSVYYGEISTFFGLGLYASGLLLGTVTGLGFAFHVMDIRFVERVIETVARNI